MVNQHPVRLMQTEEEIQHWIEHGDPATRDLRVAVWELWRRGFCILGRREDGEVVTTLTEAGRLVARSPDDISAAR